jgi:hypothetical protein
MRLWVGELATSLEALGDDLIRRLAVQHALAPGVVGGVEPAQQPLELGCEWMVMPSTSLPTRPLNRSTMPFVWGE